MRTRWAAVGLLCAAGQARGAVIFESVGSGSNTSTIVVDFGPTSYAYNVHYNSPPTGLEALQLLDAQSSFRLETTHFGFGDFVSGMEYAGHYKSGIGNNGNDWWQYWLSNDGQ